MNRAQKAPAAQGVQGAILSKIGSANIAQISLGRHQRMVLNLLQRGGRYSAADISVALHYCDPRAYIRDLRHKGVPIADEWVNENGSRFKRYFIGKEVGR